MLALPISNFITPKFDPAAPIFQQRPPDQFQRNCATRNKGAVETHHFVDYRWSVGGIVGGLSSINLLGGDTSSNFVMLQSLGGRCGCVGLPRAVPRLGS